jgi:REP element-mobilizing transposase RayT
MRRRSAAATVDCVGHPTRIQTPGTTLHVITRGSDRQRMFLDSRDYERKLRMFGAAVQSEDWIVLSYVLMPNHCHWLFRIGTAGVSNGMQWLNGGYSRATNQRYGRSMHLFRNRFVSYVIEAETHLFECLRYHAWNAPKAGLCAHPSDWPYSSYRACAGLDLAPPWLAKDEVLGLFDADPSEAAQAYRGLVDEDRV